MNADNQQRSRDLTLEPVREGAAAAHLALRSLVSDLSASVWTAKALYQTERRQSLGMMLGAITGAPRVAPARGVSCDRVGDLASVGPSRPRRIKIHRRGEIGKTAHGRDAI